MAKTKKELTPFKNIGVCYARFSSHNQKDVSIEQQVAACRKKAQDFNITLIETYEDRASTGKTDKRTNFQRMMSDAEKGKFEYLIAWKSSRIGRNMLEQLINESKLQAWGIRILYVEESFDDTAAGRFAARNMMNINQFYSENMAEDVLRAMNDNASKCLVNGLLPFVKGEGMNSPKVTGGTGSCFGGVTDELLSYGIPPVCCTDGPSGIRMDTGHKATLMPNGTCLACTWDNALVEELHSYLGIELRANNIDILLGAGINIHRSPLNGRNFEYFSEDPYLTGTMGAACTMGMSNAGVLTTIKHFACNSQESARKISDSVVSERALREIYLKPFEITVKEGKAKAIMTSYNKINGTYAASNYDLCTSILRDEWDYDGFVMTDWWAGVGSGEHNKFDLSLMVEAQNDVYMVTKSSKDNEDNLVESVNNGTLDLTYLRKCAKNILGVIINLPAMNRKPIENVNIKREDYCEIGTIENVENNKKYDIKNADALELEFTTNGSDLAQYVINIYDGDKVLTCALTQGATDAPKTVLVSLPKYEDEISLNYSSAFKYMRATLLKKNV